MSIPVIVFIALTAGLIGVIALTRSRDTRTDEYIAALDIDAISRRGADFTSDRYDPERIGKRLDEIDTHDDF